MSQRRVVVTGLGQISPVGNNVADAWQNLLAGVSGIGRITRFDAGELSAQIAGEVKDFQIGDYIGAKEARRMDAFIHYGIAAALQAVADAGLDDYAALDKTRVGVNIGSGIGGLPSIEETGIVVHENGPRRINPFFIPGSLINLIAGHVTILKGYQGPSYGIVSACTTGAHCIGDAARMIQYGDADVMVAGGAESAVCMLGVGGFAAMKALSTRNDDPATASRPWDKDRDGFVMGEGAAMLILEDLEHAMARGAQVYAEVMGYGNTADAYHITSPDPEAGGITRAIREAVAEAGLDPAEGLYINAHGTSTKLNDQAETLGFKRALGEGVAHAARISSTKSMTGHMLGAAGAVEAMVCALTLRDGVVAPTINYHDPDPECDLDYTPNEAAPFDGRWALSTNLGFGGHNAALAFKRYEG